MCVPNPSLKLAEQGQGKQTRVEMKTKTRKIEAHTVRCDISGAFRRSLARIR